jgi:ABC-type transport system involved in cytochrome bd biosynthesis fused ATPase/permease subunit
VNSAAIDVRDVTFAYPDGRRALSNVTLRVQPGERVAVLGPMERVRPRSSFT